MIYGLRKAVLTVHVIVSVGWIGAVGCFLALAVAGIVMRDPQPMRSAYSAMQLTTWAVIVPLATASLLTGIVSSLGTNWGLFRHYWVVLKLAITTLATALLLEHTRAVDLLATAATRAGQSPAQLPNQQWMMAIAAAGAVVALIALTVLSIFKPQGVTRYGERKLIEQRVKAKTPQRTLAGANLAEEWTAS